MTNTAILLNTCSAPLGPTAAPRVSPQDDTDDTEPGGDQFAAVFQLASSTPQTVPVVAKRTDATPEATEVSEIPDDGPPRAKGALIDTDHETASLIADGLPSLGTDGITTIPSKGNPLRSPDQDAAPATDLGDPVALNQSAPAPDQDTDQTTSADLRGSAAAQKLLSLSEVLFNAKSAIETLATTQTKLTDAQVISNSVWQAVSATPLVTQRTQGSIDAKASAKISWDQNEASKSAGAPQTSTAPSRDNVGLAAYPVTQSGWTAQQTVAPRPQAQDKELTVSSSAGGVDAGQPDVSQQSPSLINGVPPGSFHSAGSPALLAQSNQGPQLARHVARQMAAEISRTSEGKTEIILQPQELGRVRMQIEHQGSGISMLITADRSETADLMRRHLETLAQEFRSMGYRDVTFSFSDGSTQQQDSHRAATGPVPGDDQPDRQEAPAEPPIRPQQSSRSTSSAVDLRL